MRLLSRAPFIFEMNFTYKLFNSPGRHGSIPDFPHQWNRR